MAGRRQALAAMTCLALVLTACSAGSVGSAGTQSFAAPPRTGLARYLETPPDRSAPGTSPWARSYTPSTSAFVTHFYGAGVRTKVAATLAQQGLTGIAHVLWTTRDVVQADVVLMQFATPRGAQQRSEAVLAATEPDPTLTSYPLPGRGAPIVFYGKHADAQNNIDSRAYATVGSIFVEIFMFSPVQFEKGYLELWLRDQIALLP